MIYPTRLSVAAAAAGAPVALLLAVSVPGHWYLGLAWPLSVALLTLADGFTGGRHGTVSLAIPRTASVGEPIAATVTARIAQGQAPSRAEVAIDAGPMIGTEDDGRLQLLLDQNGVGAARLPLQALRRGTARIGALWVRWRGPMGLAWRQKQAEAPAEIAILPDIGPVREQGARLLQRHALEGLLTQARRGDGSEFETLVEFQPGMERRAIDWKGSARHGKLVAREFRTERNNQIVFAIDAGRQMAEPVAGLPRIDRAVTAMLLAAWVALKLGDRVALHAFDSRPRIASGMASGIGAFADLQRLAARIDYGTDETNYTFALTTLASALNRRSMIVLLTEIVDTTQADFMVRAAQRLVEKHLLMVVVLRDEELESIADRAPATADDVGRAVTAAALLRERRVVIRRLGRLGVHVVEAEHDRVGERLVQAYTDLKRRNLL